MRTQGKTPDTIGFLAYLSCYYCDHVVPPGGGHFQLVFDRTRYNYGSHYSTSTGKFKVPVTGLYIITAHIYGINEYPSYRLMVDNVITIWARGARDGNLVGYTNVILNLSVGQEVWIRPMLSGIDIIYGYNLDGGMNTYFGAYLLSTNI